MADIVRRPPGRVVGYVFVAALLLALAVTVTVKVRPRSTTVVVEGGPAFTVQVATTVRAQQHGLAGRTDVPAGGGMLFLFAGAERREVWMAGIEVALDVAWIRDHTILTTGTLQPCRLANADDCPRTPSPQPADALLEVAAGSLVGVRPGQRVTWS